MSKRRPKTSLVNLLRNKKTAIAAAVCVVVAMGAYVGVHMYNSHAEDTQIGQMRGVINDISEIKGKKSGTTLPHIQAILLNVSRPQILYWQECMWMPVTSRISGKWCNLTGCLINYRGTRRNTITKEHIISIGVASLCVFRLQKKVILRDIWSRHMKVS